MPKAEMPDHRANSLHTGACVRTRHKGRTDDNQKRIVRELRGMGYSVRSTAEIGSGFPDIVVGASSNNFLFEIKDPDKPPSARRLTTEETEFHAAWKGQIHVVETTEQIIQIITETL